MPTYRFRCTVCSQELSQVMPLGSLEKPLCAVCNGKTEKIMTAPMVHFKGSGFYKNDNAKTQPTTTDTPAAPKKAEAPAPSATPAPTGTPAPKNP